MKRVGLTGGIGSGKSTVARILASVGVPVYDSDSRSKMILANDPAVISAVKELLGEEAYAEGVPDRKYIASQVFSDEGKLEKLNGIIHPAVKEDFRKWAEGYPDCDYVVMESAILVESGFAGEVDVIVVVTAPEDIRVKRVVARDSSAEKAVRERVEAQMDEKARLTHADYVLYADEKRLLVPQVVEMDGWLRATL